MSRDDLNIKLRIVDKEPGVWCRHHERVHPLDHRCKLGIDIATILPRNTFGHHYAMPCNTATSDGVETRTCALRDLFTPAEIEAQRIEDEQWMRECEQRLRATIPLVEQIKKQYAGRNASGARLCPVCQTGTVAWRLSSYNNHIAMRCSTQDCINFME